MYVDSSFAEETNRKSVKGYVIQYANAVVGQRTRKQTTVVVSTTEAEFVALSEGCNKVIWFKQLLRDVQIKCEMSITVFEDSQSCIAMASSESLKARTKCVDVKYPNVKM